MLRPIPKNIENNGGVLGGITQLRNLVEAVIFGSASYMITHFTLFWTPIIFQIIIGAVFISIAAFIGLIGINHQPVTIVVADYLIYRKNRCVVTLKMPLPESAFAKNRKTRMKISKKKRKK